MSEPAHAWYDDGADEVFRALAEPRRRAILRLVNAAELAAGEIAGAFEISRPAVSQHLAVLREAGLVDERRDGTRRLYRASPSGMTQARLAFENMWSTALRRGRDLAENDSDQGGFA
ncbi:ArsR/SmtB family transcription factor [Nocardia thailandica]